MILTYLLIKPYKRRGAEVKNVQIPEELFTRLYGYFFLDKNDHLQEQIIKDMLSDKMERIQRREAYAPMPQEHKRSCKL
jgi:hypothetical protein